MAQTISFRPVSRRAILAAALLLALAALAVLGGPLLRAQIDGERGIAPVASSTDIEAMGIKVDTRGKNAQEARENGWREAQKLAWAKLGGPAMPDGQLSSLVSAVVIEREQIGPRRYIATLGVIFDRARAGRYLGGNSERVASAPMLLIPVTLSAGAAMVYEKRNPWQRAWAEFNPGASRINYVRPSGSGSDSLLLTYGQTGRRSRLWWRGIIDQFEAADIIVPIAHLERQWPGGPIEGRFTARYGPDSTYLGSFTMRAANEADLPRMLGDAVRRFDGLFVEALASGKLRPNPTLRFSSLDTDPVLARLIEIGRVARAQQAAEASAEAAANAGATVSTGEDGATPTPTPSAAVTTASFSVRFASPDAGAVDATLAAVRATPGVRGAGTTSIAIGGTSVMVVTYGGDLSQLAAALRARGFAVSQGGSALSISR